MPEKYELINVNNHLHEVQLDEWLISKAILTDNVKQFLSLLPRDRFDENKLANIKTFEPNLDLLSTAAKNCKKSICKILLENYRHIFEPNKLVNDGTPLHWLVKSNQISFQDTKKESNNQKFQLFSETFYCLVDNNSDLNIKDSKGFTALHYCAMQNNYGAALLILSNKRARKEETENQGMTALHIAARYGSESVALLLIEKLKRENLSSVDNNKMLALHHACKNKIEQTTIVQNLLEKYQKLVDHENLIKILNLKDKFESTILNLAIKENHLKIVQILLKLNSSYKSIGDHDKNLPIHIAARFGSVKMLELLENNEFISFEPNHNWNNVFHLACYANKSNFILELLNKYQENILYKEKIEFALKAFNRENITPILCAISRGSIECIEILIKKQQNWTEYLIEMFRVCIENNQKRTLKYLVNLSGQKLKEIPKDSSNNTILHFACVYKNFNLFKLLIEFILEGRLPIELIDCKNQYDESVFSIACKNGCLEIVEYLLNLKDSKNFSNYDPLNDRDDEYTTPLHSAAKTNHMRILEILVENGADVNAEDKFDKLPLHYSSEIGSLEICKLLVSYKSKINKFDIYNMTPLDYSCLIGHNEMVCYLIQNGALVHDINEEHYNCLDIAIDRNHKAVVESLLNDRNFSKFVYFENERNSKIKKLIKRMPLSMKILLDNCYDPKSQVYNFELLDNPMYKATGDHPLWLIAHYQFKYLLAHRTIKKLLELKMRKWPRIVFWTNLVSYFIFLVLLTFHHINLSFKQENLFNKNRTLGLFESEYEKTFHLWPLPYKYSMQSTWGRVFFWFYKIYFIILLIIYILKKIFQIYYYGTKIMRSIDNWLEILCFLFNILSMLPFQETSSAFGSLSVLLGWISFAFFFQMIGYFKIGSYSVALRKTIQNSFKFLPFFFMIYFGFLCSFKIRENYGIAYYNNTVGHIIKTITMMVGELQTNKMGIEIEGIDGINYFTNNVIYISFLFIMCIIVLDLFIGIEVGEIKTVIDEAETQNIGMNLIHVLKTQDILYKLSKLIYPGKVPTFMNVKECYEPKSDSFINLGKRPDLLNRVENYLVSMSHTLDQHINEQIKQMRELKEQVEIIMQQLDLLKKKIIFKDKIKELSSPVQSQTTQRKLILAKTRSDFELSFSNTTQSDDFFLSRKENFLKNSKIFKQTSV